MKIIVAGFGNKKLPDMCYKHNVSKLYSILNEQKHIEKWDDSHLLMVDSGAHSWNKFHDQIGMSSKSVPKPAHEFIETYFDFIVANRDRKVVWVEFDVYKDLDISIIDDFYYRVKKLNIAGKFIRVYHHYLDPEPGNYDTLKKWVAEGQDYIGLGADNIDNFDDIFSLTKDKVKYHGFALTRLPIIEKYPFFSVDSTSPLSTVIFGRYSTPIMAFKEREDVFKEKSIECFDDDLERLEKAVIEVKRAEEYITNIWNKKGVTWQDLKF